jgi:sugar phosphate isomerase/epimerase
MKIATQTSYLGQLLGDVEAIKLIAKVGYGGIDYSMFYMNDVNSPLHGNDYMSHVKKIKETAKNVGIPFTQGHSYFPHHVENDSALSKEVYNYAVRSLEIASYLGIESVTMHPVEFEKDQDEKNIEMFSTFIPYCKEYGVKIAIENVFKPNREKLCSDPETLNRYVDELNKNGNYFVALVDVGHAEFVGYNAADFIRGVGHHRLKGLHIQDSNGKQDLHQLPFTQRFDWNEITKALAEIDYTGDFTFEADKFLRLFPSEMVEDASRFMLKVGQQLVRMIERHKESR